MKYLKIKIGQSPQYPTDTQLTAAIETYRVSVMNNTEIPDKFLKTRFNAYVEIVACGGKDNKFMAAAYPPAGFVIKHPESVAGLQLRIARIFKYHKSQHTYTLIASTATRTPAQFDQILNDICQEA